MRKLLVVALVVFALAFTLGLITTPQSQAAGNCWYACDCAGKVLKCCQIGQSVSCKVVFNAPWGCTQQYDC